MTRLEVTRVKVTTDSDEDLYDVPPGEDLEEFILPMLDSWKRSRHKRLEISVHRVKGERFSD